MINRSIDHKYWSSIEPWPSSCLNDLALTNKFDHNLTWVVRGWLVYWLKHTHIHHTWAPQHSATLSGGPRLTGPPHILPDVQAESKFQESPWPHYSFSFSATTKHFLLSFPQKQESIFALFSPFSLHTKLVHAFKPSTSWPKTLFCISKNSAFRHHYSRTFCFRYVKMVPFTSCFQLFAVSWFAFTYECVCVCGVAANAGSWI